MSDNGPHEGVELTQYMEPKELLSHTNAAQIDPASVCVPPPDTDLKRTAASHLELKEPTVFIPQQHHLRDILEVAVPLGTVSQSSHSPQPAAGALVSSSASVHKSGKYLAPWDSSRDHSETQAIKCTHCYLSLIHLCISKNHSSDEKLPVAKMLTCQENIHSCRTSCFRFANRSNAGTRALCLNFDVYACLY